MGGPIHLPRAKQRLPQFGEHESNLFATNPHTAVKNLNYTEYDQVMRQKLPRHARAGRCRPRGQFPQQCFELIPVVSGDLAYIRCGKFSRLHFWIMSVYLGYVNPDLG